MYQKDKKIIAIDTTFLFDQYSHRGTGKYGKEFLRRFIKSVSQESAYEIHLIGFLEIEKNLKEIGFSNLKIEELIHKIKFTSLGASFDSSIKNIFNWFKYLKPAISDIEPDLFFAVHFERGLPSTKFFGGGLKNTKTVVVVHDIIPRIFNRYSEKTGIKNYIKKLFYDFLWTGVTNADLIFSPSNLSFENILTFGNVKKEKLRKVYLGVDDSFFEPEKISNEGFESILKNLNLEDKKYIFYDSGIEPNKGITELLQIFAVLSSKSSDIKNLVITGKDFQMGSGADIVARTVKGKMLLKEAKEIGILEKLVTTDRISDSMLISLLSHSKLYLYLSLYEGFGFGPLQAMACKIPAFVANRSCLPEITNGGAVLLEVGKPKKSARKILNIISDSVNLEHQITKGQKIAKSYNWENTFRQTWEEILKILN